MKAETTQATGPVADYPEIERLITSEDFNTVNQNFAKAYEALDKISRERGGLKKSKEAKQAMKAIERVMDLLRELLKLKYQMMEARPGQARFGQAQKQPAK